jgi:hypothetical protein
MMESRRMRWAGYVACMGRRGTHTGYWCERQSERPLGRPRRRWEYNVKTDLREIGWGNMDWIDLAQDRNQWPALENTVTRLRVPFNVGKLSSNCGFSRRTQLHGVRQESSGNQCDTSQRRHRPLVPVWRLPWCVWRGRLSSGCIGGTSGKPPEEVSQRVKLCKNAENHD